MEKLNKMDDLVNRCYLPNLNQYQVNYLNSPKIPMKKKLSLKVSQFKEPRLSRANAKTPQTISKNSGHSHPEIYTIPKTNIKENLRPNFSMNIDAKYPIIYS